MALKSGIVLIEYMPAAKDRPAEADGNGEKLQAPKYDTERKLRGRTLQVYIYLQRKKAPSGIREIQRELGLSSPSVAEYQVEKLVEMGLAGRDAYGRCFITRKTKVKALESYVNFGRYTVPRLAFYAAFFSAVSAIYVVFRYGNLSVYDIAVPVAAAGVLWLETWKMWKHSLLDEAMARKVTQAASPGVKEHSWNSIHALLVPGIAALIVFAAVNVFLFQYVQPTSLVATRVATPEVSTDEASVEANLFQSGLFTVDDSIKIAKQNMEDYSSANSQTTGLGNVGTVSAPENPFGALFAASGLGFAMTLSIFASALVIGFLIYIIIKVRCGNYSSEIPILGGTGSGSIAWHSEPANDECGEK